MWRFILAKKLLTGDGDIAVRKSGCHGFCEMGPLMRIEPHDVLYTKVSVEDCEEIFNKTIRNGELIPRLLFKQNGQGLSASGGYRIL